MIWAGALPRAGVVPAEAGRVARRPGRAVARAILRRLGNVDMFGDWFVFSSGCAEFPGKPERGLKAAGLDLSPGKSRYADAGMEGWGMAMKRLKWVVRGVGNEVWFST